MKKPKLPETKYIHRILTWDNSIQISKIWEEFKDAYSSNIEEFLQYSKVTKYEHDPMELFIDIPPTKKEIDEYDKKLAEYNEWRKLNPPVKRKTKTKEQKLKEQAEKELAQLEKRRTELLNIVKS